MIEFSGSYQQYDRMRFIYCVMSLTIYQVID